MQYLEDDVVIKSRTWTTEVLKALEEAGETPDPESGWVAQMMAEIDEKLSAQGVDAAEVNELIAAYLAENPVTVETPTYDFTDLGEVNITPNSIQCLETEYDTANLISDIEKGTINIKFNVTLNSTTITYTVPLHFYKQNDEAYMDIALVYTGEYGATPFCFTVIEEAVGIFLLL